MHLPFDTVEGAVNTTVQWLRLLIETTGALVVAIGVVAAWRETIRTLFTRRDNDFGAIRLILSRYLALALEFQLGADILSTAIAPSFEQIGKLGAIAIIRTALNYFLTREMETEKSAGSQPPALAPNP